jgi:hypothetical protein
MTLACALALALGSLLSGQGRHAGRLVGLACQSVGFALLLCAPWVVGTLLAGKHAVEIFGLPISGSAAPSWGEVIRFAIGPTARSPIVWLLVAAAALPLLIGTGMRLRGRSPWSPRTDGQARSPRQRAWSWCRRPSPWRPGSDSVSLPSRMI